MNPSQQDPIQNQLVALTRDLILIRSTDTRRDEIGRCFEFLTNHIECVEGIAIQQHTRNGHDSLVAMPENVSSPEILLCGHIDVIEHPQDDCYHAKLKDGRIIGPGAGDMKGQVAVLVELFRNLHAAHPGLSLGIALTSDEEIGGVDGMRFLCHDLGLRCGCAIVPDGGSLCDITVEEKGVLHLSVQRDGKEAHGARPWLGENSIELLLQRLKALKDHFQRYWPIEPVEDQLNDWFPTCTITSVYTPNRTSNRIPSSATALLDVRFPRPNTTASMLSTIETILTPDCVVTPLMVAEPAHLDPDPLFAKITEQLTGQEVRYVKASGASDSRFLREYDIPVNLSRPLVGNLHAVDEWIDIPSMVTYYQICERYISEKLTSN